MGWRSCYLGTDHIGLVPFSLVFLAWFFGVVALIWRVIEMVLWTGKFLPVNKRATQYVVLSGQS